jgi:CHAT domain-containing protein/tetratricopeptide (TPR) repeat protein
VLAAIEGAAARAGMDWPAQQCDYVRALAAREEERRNEAAARFEAAAAGPDPGLATDARCNLGLLALTDGDLTGAELHFQAVIELAGTTARPAAVGFAYLGLGKAALERHHDADAAGWLERAHATAQATDDAHLLAQATVQLGIARARLGRDDEAEALYAATRQMRESASVPPWLRSRAISAAAANRAILALRTGRREEADEAVEQALTAQAFLPSGEKAENLVLAGEVAMLHGDFDRATERLRAAFELAEGIAYPRAQVMAGRDLALSYCMQGAYEPARRVAVATMAAIERLRPLAGSEADRLGYFTAQLSIYETAVIACIATADLTDRPAHRGEALIALERAKARTLVDALGTTDLTAPAGVPPSLLMEEARLLEQRRAAEHALRAGPAGVTSTTVRRHAASLDDALDRLWRTLAETAPSYVALRHGRPATLDDVRSLLTPSPASERRLVLAEYYLGDAGAFLFVMRADMAQPEVIELPVDQTELRRFVRSNFGEHNRVREVVELGLDELWHGLDVLVAPLAGWLEPDDVLCVVPHGLLHYLPLHALRLDGRYVIERNPVVYSPSVTVLKYCRAGRRDSARPSRRTAAVFGDARDDLPASRAEAVAVARLLGSEPILGSAVTRQAFWEAAAASTDIVHFAGHGDFSGRDALASGLRLAGGDVLTARDVFAGAPLDAALVTLSGCETGVSEHHPGDELLGLTRAFMYRGVPSLVVSLWRVADRSAEFLMRRFYGHLLTDPPPATVDALRAAMLETMAQPGWSPFYHWAPFVLVGDWA